MDFPTRKQQKRTIYLVLVATGLVCLALGVIIGWFSNNNPRENISPNDVPNNHFEHKQHLLQMEDSFQRILNELNKENIRSNLKNYTSKQRLAGTQNVKDMVKYIAQQWRDNGLDKVEVTPYEVLMSYPNITNPNRVEIVIANGGPIFTSAFVEKALDDDGNQSDIIPPYNSWAPAGVAEVPI
ncbi:hypothetical protein CHS0354_022971 [Potamilus streckersoni]|uniref:Uncharacterized protein n=1 Tax=Potamilus streckersoni TaxID=2493646 RepID=A0AAE0S567_9BIVA|nr:hypothetical protein CHS0354_022971 [Potamilus streckersoni]